MSFRTMPSMDGKADIFSPGYEELGTDFFDEFLTFNNNIEHLDYTTIPPAAGYLDVPNSASTSAGTSLSFTDDDVKLQFDNNGLGESPLLSPPNNQFYNDLMGRASISDTELLNLGDITLESPQVPDYPQRSLPSSPTPIGSISSKRKNKVVDAISKSLKKATTSIDKALLRSPIRKQASVSKMNAYQQSQNSNAWGQRLEQEASKFNFDFNENSRALTPPLTCKVEDISPDMLCTPSKSSNGYTMTPHQGTSAGPFTTPRRTGSVAYTTPLATPSLESHHSRNSSSQFPPSSPMFPVTPKNQSVSASWGQLAGSPPANNYRTTAAYPDMEEPLWWSHASTTKMAQPQPNVYHTDPQRATKTLAMQLQNEAAYNSAALGFEPVSIPSGLMIQMPAAHPPSMGLGSPQPRQHSFFGSPQQQQQQQQRQQPRPQYSPSHLRRQQDQPIQTLPQQQSQLNVRKQRTASLSDSPSPTTPSSSSFHVRKRRSSKNIKHATPRTPSLGTGVDFVNFTPHDSKRILTGVAPSGSSKTKARREKEALEKRRKLSQAAVRAVRAAGGDIEALVEEGLFV